MILDKQGYAYADLTIVPAEISDINSRRRCDVYDENGNLPIFTAPMMTVVNEYNYDIYKKNKINVIIPRTVRFKKRIELMENEYWVAFSLKEFSGIFGDRSESKIRPQKGHTYRICIDMANGHMRSLYDNTVRAKERAEKVGYTLIIMTGNIANPETYEWICKNGNVDYIRCAIGSGATCITASNTGTHYPIATLIDECKKIKDEYSDYYYEPGTEYIDVKCTPAIVADGGIKNYSDITKALALGADYVMIGSLFGSLLESSADMFIEAKDSAQYPATYDRETGTVVYYTATGPQTINIWNGNSEEEKISFIRSASKIKKRQVGMSTKEAQLVIGRCLEEPVEMETEKLKTSEGITTYTECKYTMKQWLENMVDYLRSCMSYCGCNNLKQFKNECNLIVNSPAEIQAVNK